MLTLAIGVVPKVNHIIIFKVKINGNNIHAQNIETGQVISRHINRFMRLMDKPHHVKQPVNFNDVSVKKYEKLRKYSYGKLANFYGEIRRLWRPLKVKLCSTGSCSKALQTGKDVRNNICHDW